METRYNIYRLYSDINKPRKLKRKGLTLKEAQEHCNDPETSSRTNGVKNQGCEWFDSYFRVF